MEWADSHVLGLVLNPWPLAFYFVTFPVDVRKVVRWWIWNHCEGKGPYHEVKNVFYVVVYLTGVVDMLHAQI